jgi:hypothetical protein
VAGHVILITGQKANAAISRPSHSAILRLQGIAAFASAIATTSSGKNARWGTGTISRKIPGARFWLLVAIIMVLGGWAHRQYSAGIDRLW